MTAKKTVHFRIAATDYAAHVIGIPLSKQFLGSGSNLSFAMSPSGDGVFDAMDRGRIDLLLRCDDGLVPPRFPRQVIFEEKVVCVVSKDRQRGNKLTRQQYLDGLHVGVDTFGGSQSIPEQRLAAIQQKRGIAFTVPFHNVAINNVAINMVAGTNLIATMPKRIVMGYAQDPELKIMKAPKAQDAFSYLMVWHPRMSSDAAHIWLRNIIVEVAGTIKKNDFLNATSVDGRAQYAAKALEEPTLKKVIGALFDNMVAFLTTPGHPPTCMTLPGAVGWSVDALVGNGKRASGNRPIADEKPTSQD